jgi:hypothetical protein
MEFDLDLAVQVLTRTPSTVQQLLQGLGREWVLGTFDPR